MRLQDASYWFTFFPNISIAVTAGVPIWIGSVGLAASAYYWTESGDAEKCETDATPGDNPSGLLSGAKAPESLQTE